MEERKKKPNTRKKNNKNDAIRESGRVNDIISPFGKVLKVNYFNNSINSSDSARFFSFFHDRFDICLSCRQIFQ